MVIQQPCIHCKWTSGFDQGYHYYEGMKKPDELSYLFNDSHFRNYPLVEIPQIFKDDRGLIANIADGDLGDVALITSNFDSIRANHYHKNDWHLSYLVSGTIVYTWKAIHGQDEGEIVIEAGQLFYTPKMVAHRMKFVVESTFVAISKLNRNKENYEADTNRLDHDFFS